MNIPNLQACIIVGISKNSKNTHIILATRKTIVLIFCLVFISIICISKIKAQGFESSLNNGKFIAGAIAGVQFAKITSNNSEVTAIPGFTAGIYGEYYFKNNFKVKLEIYLDRRSFSIKSKQFFRDTSQTWVLSNSYHQYEANFRLNYLTIPLGIVYEVRKNNFKALFEFSLYYSFFIQSYMEVHETYYYDPEDGHDLSESNLHYGINDFIYSGRSYGMTFKNTNKAQSNEYVVDYYRHYDFGAKISISFVYQISRKIGLIFSSGLTFSEGSVYENHYGSWKSIGSFKLGLFVFVN